LLRKAHTEMLSLNNAAEKAMANGLALMV